LVGENLIKPSNSSQLLADDEDFDDEDSWPQDLPVDIQPRQIIENLPGYEEGAYHIEYYDPMVDLIEKWENETISK